MNYKPIDFNSFTNVIDHKTHFVEEHFSNDLTKKKCKLSEYGWLQLISVRTTYDFYQLEVESKEVKQENLIKILKFPNILDKAKREYYIKVIKSARIMETFAFKSLLESRNFPVEHLMNTEIENIVDMVIDEINPKRISEFSRFISNKLYATFTNQIDPKNIKAFVLSYESSNKDAYQFIEDQISKNLNHNRLDDLQLKIIYQYGLSLLHKKSELISLELGLDFQNNAKCLEIENKFEQTLKQAIKLIPDTPKLRQYRGRKF